MTHELAGTSDPAQLEASTTPPAEHPRAWRLAVQALLLNDQAYAAVRDAVRPLRRGFVAMLVVWGIVLVARLIGVGLGYLTSPQLGRIEQIIRDFVVTLPWYTDQVRAVPTFATQFAQGYAVGWEALRMLLGIPTWSGTIGSITGMVLATLSAWFVYGVLAHWLARWFGGQARFSQTLGVLSLAYAPLLLLVIELMPGARVPTLLLFLALLVAKYQALKQAHGLAPGYTLAAVIGPFVIVFIILVGVILFGAAYGVQQVPVVQPAVSTSSLLTFAGI
jgi:hypothetical protein